MLSKMQFDVLEALADTIQPFAVIYRDMTIYNHYEDLSVSDLANELLELILQRYIECTDKLDIASDETGSSYVYKSISITKQELIEVYEPYISGLDVKEIDYDEMKYNFALTKIGYEATVEYAVANEGYKVNPDDKWRIIGGETDEVRIIASTKNGIKVGLAAWESKNKGKKMIDDSVVFSEQRYKQSYYLADEPGILMTFRYEEVI
ncbi:MAG: hypothetical protein ACYC4M_04350 [Thermoleophilia bacterium]